MSQGQKEKQAKEAPLRRFWKPLRSLPSVEWDGERKRARFEFIRGVFETRDQKLAEELKERGYKEVGLDEKVPTRPPQEGIPDRDALPQPQFAMQPGTVQQMRALGLKVPMSGDR